MIIPNFNICPKCGKPRSDFIVDWLGHVREVGCLCDCQMKAIEDYEAAFAERSRDKMLKSKIHSFAEDDSPNSEASRQAHIVADKMLKDSTTGVIITGDVEQGKTFYGECILRELYDHHRKVCVFKPDRSITLSHYDAIMVDDVDKSSTYQWKVLFDAIDLAYRRNIQVIITTNDTPEQMATCEDSVKKAVYSRLFEMCYIWELETGRRRNVKGRI